MIILDNLENRFTKKKTRNSTTQLQFCYYFAMYFLLV